MTNRQFTILILMIVAATGAVIGAQLYLIYNAYKLQEANFSHAIEQALQKTTAHVEANNGCFEAFNKITLGEQQDIVMLRRDAQHQKVIDTIRQYISSFDDDSLMSYDDLATSFPVTAEILVKYHYTPRGDIGEQSFLNAHNHQASIKKDEYSNFFGGTFSLSYFGATEYYTRYLDSLLRFHLEQHGIQPEYYFALKDAKTDRNTLGNMENKALPKNATVYESTFYNNSSFYSPQTLQLWILGQNRYMLGSISGVLAGSFIVLLFLGGVVVMVVRTILKQKKLSEVKNDFINNMTHEFKTPIANISLALQTIGKLHPEEQKTTAEYLSVIVSENNRLSNNVEKILQLSAMTHERIRLRHDWTDLREIVEDVTSGSTFMKNTTGCRISADCLVETPVYIDKVHFSNILYNLIDNALKYNAGNPEVTITATQVGSHVHIVVADNGIGIPAADIPYIFDRFYRVSTGNLHNVKGFGLGLSYVKEIVEAHGGNITVKSRQGKGSVFKIVVPVNGTEKKSNGVSAKKQAEAW